MTARLFDTNIVIDALKNHEQARVIIDAASPITISRITWIEVLTGAKWNEELRTRGFLRGCRVIELNAAIAERAATLRRESRIKLFDAIILATALESGRVLVTRDEGIPGGPLQIERPYKI